jgi:hypothetical protein
VIAPNTMTAARPSSAVGRATTDDQTAPPRQDLHSRICEACGNRSISEIGRLTGTNHETARRYIRGITVPPPKFLAAVSELSGVSIHWLLCGKGEKLQAEVDREVVKGSSTRSLIAELAERLNKSVSPRQGTTSSRGSNGAPENAAHFARQMREWLATTDAD